MPNIIDIIIKAIPDAPAWIWHQIDITLKATPAGFGLPLWYFLAGFFIIYAGWDYLYGRE